MANALEHILIYVSLCIFTMVAVLADSFGFDKYRAMLNTYCSDHATDVAVMASRIVCSECCLGLDDCRGFYYGTVTRVCTVVKVIAIPYSGCREEAGTSYYVKLAAGMFEPYGYTSADYAMMDSESEYRVCTSHPYHVFVTDMTTTGQYGCRGSWCCKTIGCYSGEPHLYNGTWSQTEHGRTCQAWVEQSPHYHYQPMGDLPPGETLETASNFCRDTDYAGYLWCYTTDPDVRSGRCDVPSC